MSSFSAAIFSRSNIRNYPACRQYSLFYEERKFETMKRFYQSLAIFVMALFLPAFLAVPAFAVSGFSDIPADSNWYEAVTYLADHEITYGTGNQYYSPNELITVRQWASMLCRAFGNYDLDFDGAEVLGDTDILCCYREGWLTENAVEAPDSHMCRSALLQSAFRAAGIPVYDSALYPGGEELSPYDNVLRVGKELALCEQDSASLDLMTRGDAAQILYQLLVCEYEIEEPPMVSAVFLYNLEGVRLNPYLMELNRIPTPILQVFESSGWKYVIDYGYLEDFSRRQGIDCIGATSYSTKEIYVSIHTATGHEFGHFLDQILHFPSKHDTLFKAEAQSSRAVLRDYAATNSREYFAEYFAYWIVNRKNVDKMERLASVSPETYEYFTLLEANGWTARKAAN